MSKIQWTDETWNPVRGCSRVSAGCDNCYAMAQAHRFSGAGQPYEGLTTIRRGKVDWVGKARIHENTLDLPLRWRKPRRVFVNSMSDLFHESLTNEDIDRVFGVMLACNVFDNRARHTFQVLTKRPDGLREYLSAPPAELLQRWAKTIDGWWHVGDGDIYFSELVYSHCLAKWDSSGRAVTKTAPWSHCENLFPLPNVHLGVSVENQETADERIPLLLQTPAAVRFVSAEPLLGPVEFDRIAHPELDWVIVGGESGAGARPCYVDWIRAIVRYFQRAGVPVFVKQFGSNPWISGPWLLNDDEPCAIGHYPIAMVSKKGDDPAEWPEDLRVREFPEVSRDD